jgi:hypothetical protein
MGNQRAGVPSLAGNFPLGRRPRRPMINLDQVDHDANQANNKKRLAAEAKQKAIDDKTAAADGRFLPEPEAKAVETARQEAATREADIANQERFKEATTAPETEQEKPTTAAAPVETATEEWPDEATTGQESPKPAAEAAPKPPAKPKADRKAKAKPATKKK